MIRFSAVVAVLALGPAGAVAEALAKTDDAVAKPATSPAAAKPEETARPPARADAAVKPERTEGAKPKASTAAKPSKVALDLARALTPEETWNGILDAYATSLTGQISAALGASGKEPDPELRQKIRSDLADTVRYDEAIDMQARALAFRFSTEELATLERFYRSGPGKKLLEVLPEVSGEVNDDLRTRLSQRVPDLVRKHAPSLATGGEERGGANASGTASGGGGAAGGEGTSGSGTSKPDGEVEGGTPRR